MSCTEPKTTLTVCANPKCENVMFVPVDQPNWMCDDCQDATAKE